MSNGVTGVGPLAWVVGTNAVFVLPLAYLIQTRKSENAVHALLVLCTMFFSTIMHLCDNPSSISTHGYCMTKFSGLLNEDYTMCLLVIVNVLSYRLPVHLRWVRDCTIVATFAVKIFLDSVYSELDYSAYYGFGVCIAVMLLAIRVYYRCIAYSIKGVIAVVLFVIGFIFFLTSDYAEYQYLHGVWHVFAALGIWVAFEYWDSLHYETHDHYLTPK